MRIAIIGAGVSGLTAAYRLHTEHDVTVFEQGEHLGGHANTVDVELDGERHSIDTGFVVFNDRTYPRFLALLDELGVAAQPTSMSFSVRDDRTGLEYNGHSLNGLFAQRRNLIRPSFYRMLRDVVRFNRQSRRLGAHDRGCATVGEFLTRRGYSSEFVQQYLLPMGAAIWSCPVKTFAEFPLRFVVQFFENHGLLDLIRRPTWRVVCGGSRTYVQALTRSFRDRIRLRTPVVGIRRSVDCVVVQAGDGAPEVYDHVVFACHSDQALRILGDEASTAERQALSALPYGRNVAVLHTDVRLLPRTRRAWASWNFRISEDPAEPPSVTYNMNLLQGLRSRHVFCVTLNDEERITPDRVLRRIVYHHPIFTMQREAAQARHGELLAAHRTSYCGAYWRNGFHEDGVTSALAVVEAIRSGNPPSRPAERQATAACGTGGAAG